MNSESLLSTGTNSIVAHPVKLIVALATFRALLIFVPIFLIKLMPESNWYWRGLLGLLLLALAAELGVSVRYLRGWSCAFGIAGSVGWTIIGLPIVAFVAFLLSLAIGTFEFPPM